MKYILKSCFAIALLASTAAIQADSVYGRPFFLARPQEANLGREMVGNYEVEHRYDMDEFYGSLEVAIGGGNNFSKDKIGKYLFFNSSGSNSMLFGNAAYGGNAATTDLDVSAVNFVLPNQGFYNTVVANPKVSNIYGDFRFYLGFDEWVKGLYLKVGLPVVRTKYNVNLTETSTGTGCTTMAAGIFDAASKANPNKTVAEAWDGQYTLGDITENQTYGRVISGGRPKTRLSDIPLDIGWDFIRKERGHFGLFIRCVFPTGNKPDGTYLFEPIVGNGKHWELGGGLTSNIVLWDKDVDQSFNLEINARGTHLFKATEKRSFDLTSQAAGSRYLLVKEFDSTPTYAGKLHRGIDIFTTNAKVTVAFQGEAAAMFTYKYKGFTFDLGYNIWGRTKEKINSIVDSIASSKYALYDVTLANCLVAHNGLAVTGVHIDGTSATSRTIAAGCAYYLSDANLDLTNSAAGSALTNSVFANFGYRWDNDWLPFIGVGGQCEFASGNSALNQWQVWGKLGFGF